MADRSNVRPAGGRAASAEAPPLPDAARSSGGAGRPPGPAPSGGGAGAPIPTRPMPPVPQRTGPQPPRPVIAAPMPPGISPTVPAPPPEPEPEPPAWHAAASGGSGASLGNPMHPASGGYLAAPLAPPASSMSHASFPSFPGDPAAMAQALPKICSTCAHRYPIDFLICPRDATPLHSEDDGTDPLLTKVLGDTYQVIRLVGEGGMGKVYEAKHLRLRERRFAVKVLHAEFASNADIVQRFQREAETASGLDHPNVVGVYDVHRMPDGTPYLVAEFLDGEELGAQLKRLGKLEVAPAVAIVRQVCRALSAAHARGIVHRDMKPENVFVTTRDGAPVAKVLDFGISKAGQGNSHLTRTGVILGTPAYMAPEQARGEKVDLRADIYAVGAMLYHLLTGRPPFDADDAGTVITQVLTEEPPRPRAVEPRIPEAMELVIQRAMSKDPRERFQSMAELDGALAVFDRAGSSPALVLPPASHENAKLDSTTQHALQLAAGGAAQAPNDKQARLARPVIVALATALVVWLLGGFIAAVGGIVRHLRSTDLTPGELTPTETALLILGTLLAAGTPAFLFVSHARKIWPNSVKAVQLASDLWRIGAAAFVTYGVVAIVGRIVATVLLRSSTMLASGLWDASLFGASIVIAIAAGGVGPLARRFKRRANG